MGSNEKLMVFLEKENVWFTKKLYLKVVDWEDSRVGNFVKGQG